MPHWTILFLALLLLACGTDASQEGGAPSRTTSPVAVSPTATTSPSPTGLAIQSLAQDAPTQPGPEQPIVYLAGQPADLPAFLPFLTPADQQAVQAVDLTTQVVLAVFQGPIGSAGHTLTVQVVTLEAATLRITVALNPPAPPVGATVFTYPYHVVTIDRTSLGTRLPTSWVLFDSAGQLLASSS